MKAEDREEQLRRRLVDTPRRVRRQLDKWRVARGMRPLWTSGTSSSSSKRPGAA